MKNLNNLKEKVKKTLEIDIESRNCDIRLAQMVWYIYHRDSLHKDQNGIYWVKMRDLSVLPREDHISRVRRKIQESAFIDVMNGKQSAVQYLPTRPEVVKQRKMNEDNWRSFLRSA